LYKGEKKGKVTNGRIREGKTLLCGMRLQFVISFF